MGAFTFENGVSTELVNFILLFFWYAAAHFIKIISYWKHKVPANGAIGILGDKVSAWTAGKAYILVQQVIYGESQLQIILFKESFGKGGIHQGAIEVGIKSFGFAANIGNSGRSAASRSRGPNLL